MNVTLRFQSTGTVPRGGAPITMRGASMTIGRGQENDMVLPDPDRLISKTHCVIEDQNGKIMVLDMSTNGTFLNYAKVPIGKTPKQLNDGDVLTLGTYELVVALAPDPVLDAPRARRQEYFDDSHLPPPLGEEVASHGRSSRAPDPMKLLDDTGPGGDFLDNLLSDPKGLRGHKQLKAGQEVDFDGLLPPLGDNDHPVLGRAPDAPMGPAIRDHGAMGSDAFRPTVQSRSVIPDDFDDDLLAPMKPAQQTGFSSNPFETKPPKADLYATDPGPAPFAPPPQSGAQIPDFDDDLLAPAPRPSVPPPTAAPPPALPVAQPGNPFADTPSAAAELQHISADLPQVDRVAAAPDPLVLEKPVPHMAAAPTMELPLPSPPVAFGGTPTNTDTARAFIAAMGGQDVQISDAELPATMVRLGSTLRAMIVGLREILMTRTSIKSEFRIDQTMINKGGNNPLKFSVSPEQAIEAMVKPTAKGYLPADEATAQALDDIKAHEVAMVTGMEAALKGVLAKLDPALLASRIEAKGSWGLLKGKKAQYWETYEKMYAEISDQAENDFHEVFSREFAQAYKQQLAQIKKDQI